MTKTLHSEAVAARTWLDSARLPVALVNDATRDMADMVADLSDEEVRDAVYEVTGGRMVDTGGDLLAQSGLADDWPELPSDTVANLLRACLVLALYEVAE